MVSLADTRQLCLWNTLASSLSRVASALVAHPAPVQHPPSHRMDSPNPVFHPDHLWQKGKYSGHWREKKKMALRHVYGRLCTTPYDDWCVQLPHLFVFLLPFLLSCIDVVGWYKATVLTLLQQGKLERHRRNISSHQDSFDEQMLTNLSN